MIDYIYKEDSLINSNFTGMIKNSNKTILYYVNGKLHKEDGPAVIFADGTITYFWHDQYHRTDGPAIIHSDGSCYYYQHDQLHRTDGPAIIDSYGNKEYFINNNQVNASTDDEFKDYMMLRMFA